MPTDKTRASQEERELEKQIAALTLKVAKSRKLAKPVIDETDELSDELSDVVNLAAEELLSSPIIRLTPVFDCIRQLNHLPRVTLLRRFEEEITPLPRRWKNYRDANNHWLRTALARNFQRHHYEIYGIPVPASVQLADRIFAMCSPWRGTSDEEELRHPFENDDTVRIIAALEGNTFAEPRFTKYEVIRLAGEKGVSYKELIVKYRHLVANEMLPNDSTSKPEDWAWSAFTRWVEKGITEMIA